MTDWERYFLPAVQQLWQGISPYSSVYVFNPPWTFLLLAPLGLLPPGVGVLAGYVLPWAALIYAAWRRRKPYLIAIVGLSFPFTALVLYGNLDWLVLLGVVTPGWFGMFLLTTKPQAGALAFVAALKDRTWRERALLVLPLAVGGGALVLLFPDWLGNVAFAAAYDQRERNFSLFPWTIPLAFPLLWLCYRRKEPLWGVLASLCLSPYFYAHSLTPALFLIADKSWKWGVALAIASRVFAALVGAGVIPMKL